MNEKIRKLIAIRDAWATENEREIAKRILSWLEEKGYSITEEKKLVWKQYRVEKKMQDFFWQIFENVFWDNCDDKHVIDFRYNNGRFCELQMTEFEHLEFETKFEFYSRDYELQSNLFYRAYVQKNHLYSTRTENWKQKVSTLSWEEAEKLVRMQFGIERAEFLKQLTKG